MTWLTHDEFVPIDGGALWTASQGAGVPLVLCHGGPGLCDNLGAAADLVSEAARVHRYDQRGNGRSLRSGPFDVSTFVGDLEVLREYWGYERWVVGGHSWGAALALFYAAAHPERTAGVVSVSGTGVRWGWQDGTRRHRLARLTPEERREIARLASALADGGASSDDRARFLRLMWSTDFVDRGRAAAVLDAGPLYRYARDATVFRAVAADQRRILEAGFASTLAALAFPVLALHGDGDAGVERSREVAALAPRGRLVVLEGAGHSPWLETPEPFGRAIIDFLAAL